MTNHAKGRFDVTMKPADTSAEGTQANIARMTMRKKWQGDLEGESTGEFLGFRSSVDGSAAYVVLERFEGTLAGQRGSFVLAHRGLMNRGAQSMAIDVVADSATGELAGLRGTLLIVIEGGDHRYELTWEI